jgi:hypothetical protein
MNKRKCKKWYGKLKKLRGKHAEFRQAYADALQFAEENPGVRETSFGRCRVLFDEIKVLVLALREDFLRLTKEQKVELEGLQTRFDEMPQLHKGIKWADVEKALLAAPEMLNKLAAFDEKGHEMNVFGEENGEFVIASAWTDVEMVAEDHRNICFDAEGQTIAEENGEEPNGNAVDIIAKIMGVKEDEARDYLADQKFYKKLRKLVRLRDWAWLKTDAATRKFGGAFFGVCDGVFQCAAQSHFELGSFCAALRVKKA